MKTNAVSKEIEYISVDHLRPNPYQPRKYFNQAAIEELAVSIESYGMLQPLSVRRIGETSFELIAGERRLRAAKLLGLKTVPSIIMETIEQDSAVLALIENVQREDLNYIEEAISYSHLINDHGLTQEEIAKKIGKTQSTIANKLRLLRLSDNIKKTLIDNSLSERHARALLRLPDEELQIEILKKVSDHRMTVKKTEELVEKTRRKLVEVNNHTGDKRKRSRAKVKSYINFRIYINTIKNAFQEIKNSGINASFDQKEYDGYIEIKIRLPKEQ